LIDRLRNLGTGFEAKRTFGGSQRCAGDGVPSNMLMQNCRS
jgi:hypothetical protein